MPTQLSVTNDALRLLGEHRLSSIDDSVKVAREAKDAFQSASGAALEAYNWNFAQVRVALARLAEKPTFGWTYYYAKPADWSKTVLVRDQPDLDDDQLPATRYIDESGMLASDSEALYMKYVSAKFILSQIGEWPQTYADYVSAELATRIAVVITASGSTQSNAAGALESRRRRAISFDTQQQPAKRRQPGSWVTARIGGRYTQYRDR